MYLVQMQQREELLIKISSGIQMQTLINTKVHVAEEASYNEDRLMHSRVYREVNGKPKANRQTRYGGGYELITGGKKEILNHSGINYNLARLYCKEPVQQTQVYSDAFRQFFAINAIGTHKYKLALPYGNYNVY